MRAGRSARGHLGECRAASNLWKRGESREIAPSVHHHVLMAQTPRLLPSTPSPSERTRNFPEDEPEPPTRRHERESTQALEQRGNVLCNPARRASDAHHPTAFHFDTGADARIQHAYLDHQSDCHRHHKAGACTECRRPDLPEGVCIILP
jgi:hypothetical protein